MPLTTSLIRKLQKDFPDIQFLPGDDFYWNPTKQTVYFISGSDSTHYLLHETAHAVLHHTQVGYGIELLACERAAWQYATSTLGPRYDTTIEPDRVEDALDSYRDWLHARSQCPSCNAVGIEIKRHQYRCLACYTAWRANDGRTCQLRRYPTEHKQPH
jgi:hypothetical protein